jgi:hypothetical protein
VGAHFCGCCYLRSSRSGRSGGEKPAVPRTSPSKRVTSASDDDDCSNEINNGRDLGTGRWERLRGPPDRLCVSDLAFQDACSGRQIFSRTATPCPALRATLGGRHPGVQPERHRRAAQVAGAPTERRPALRRPGGPLAVQVGVAGADRERFAFPGAARPWVRVDGRSALPAPSSPAPARPRRQPTTRDCWPGERKEEERPHGRSDDGIPDCGQRAALSEGSVMGGLAPRAAALSAY